MATAKKQVRKADIIIVHGPQGCGKTTNMYRIADYFGANVIRDEQCCSEWPCPLSLRKHQRVLYLCQQGQMSDKNTLTRIGRYVAEGWVVRAVPFKELPPEVISGDAKSK